MVALLVLFAACTDPLPSEPVADAGSELRSDAGSRPADAGGPRDAGPPPLDGIPINTWVVRAAPPFPLSPGMPNKHVQITYDSRRHVLHFYGGDYCAGDRSSCNSHEEIYRYDVATDTWSVLLDRAGANTDGFPRGRCIAAMAYDAARDVIWMHAGQERHNEYYAGLESGGLWAFDLTTERWIRHGISMTERTTQPAAYELAFMRYDPVNDALLQPSPSSNVARFPLAGMSVTAGAIDAWQSSGSLPTEEYLTGNTAFAIDTTRGRAVFYLGESGETWGYDLRTGATELLSSERLRPWSTFGIAYSSADDSFVVFGGLDAYEGDGSSGSYGDQLYVLDAGSSDWRELALPGDVPTPRKGENITYDEHNDVFVLYGGTGGGQGIGELDERGYDGSEIFLLRLRDP